MFAANLILAAAWVALTGDLSLVNILIGFTLGYGVMWVASRAWSNTESTAYISRVPKFLKFCIYFFYSIIEASLIMAKAVMSPSAHYNPAIVEIPLDLKSAPAIAFFANWITLTPGTLTLEVAEDRSRLFVHTFQVGKDAETFRKQIKHDFERRVQEVFEPNV